MRKNLAFAFFVICLISCNERLEENRKEIKQNNLSGISTHDVYFEKFLNIVELKNLIFPRLKRSLNSFAREFSIIFLIKTFGSLSYIFIRALNFSLSSEKVSMFIITLSFVK